MSCRALIREYVGIDPLPMYTDYSFGNNHLPLDGVTFWMYY
ncbi:hypothetical protein M2146_002706 [Lachnospiraceae bacterium PF1-22]